MAASTQSWAAVEEKLTMGFAMWKSKVPNIPRSTEHVHLVDGTSIFLADRGVATVRIGKLEWELTPPSDYAGYCETEDDWLLVSGSGFKVAVRSPNGTRLQVCPCNEEVGMLRSKALLPLSMQNLGLREESLGLGVSIDNLDVDDKLNNLLAGFFSPQVAGSSISSSLRRTNSQKKRAEILGEKFGAPFLECVNGLQTAKKISDVLEILIGFSAVYVSNQQALRQIEEESDGEDSYFYYQQVWEEHRSRKNDSLWIRQQVSQAGMKCQAAAVATSEVAKVCARMLLSEHNVIHSKEDGRPTTDSNSENKYNSEGDNLSDSEMDDTFEVNPAFRSRLRCGQDENSMYGSSSNFEDLVAEISGTRQHRDSDYPESGAVNLDGPSLECDQNENVDLDGRNNPTSTFPRTHSFGSPWQSDVGNDTSSESSWDLVGSQNTDLNVGDEVDAEFSDAESLDLMLRDLDPFGKRDCSPLINDFFDLNINSAAASSSPDQNCSVKEVQKAKVLERLASWSSSNSGNWTDQDIRSSASSASKMRTVPLETLSEEPACDSEIARLYRSYVFQAAALGNVLQWCSCKFNKSRGSIELKFQVGSFMEDDVATMSTGISRAYPLWVEIFLCRNDVRECLLEGNVRISAHQDVPFDSGVPWKDQCDVPKPAVGFSCYIPHLVRQYLKQDVRERSMGGYTFPDGELLTGLMKYVVAQLVFMRNTCCVCNHEMHTQLLTSIVPRPCQKNLCQALYNAWLEVAPPIVLDLSDVQDWLEASFNMEDLDYEFMFHVFEHHEQCLRFKGREEAYQTVAKWLAQTVAGSWLKVIIPAEDTEERLQKSDSEKPRNEQTVSPRDSKRRKTLEWQSEDPPARVLGSGNGNRTEYVAPTGWGQCMEQQNVDMISSSDDEYSSTALQAAASLQVGHFFTTPTRQSNSQVCHEHPSWRGELFASTLPLVGIPPQSQGVSSSQVDAESFSFDEIFEE